MGRPRKNPLPVEGAEVVETVEVVEAIEEVETVEVAEVEAVDEPAEAPVAGPNTITNIIKGTTLHLGDGRKIAFGESADVRPALAALLRGTGQAQ